MNWRYRYVEIEAGGMSSACRGHGHIPFPRGGVIALAAGTTCGLEAHRHDVGCLLDPVHEVLSAYDLLDYEGDVYITHIHGASCYLDDRLDCLFPSSPWLMTHGNVHVLHNHDASVCGDLCRLESNPYRIWDGRVSSDNGDWDPDGGVYVVGQPGAYRDGADSVDGVPVYQYHVHDSCGGCALPVVVNGSTVPFDRYSCGKEEHVHDASCLAHRDVVKAPARTPFATEESVTVGGIVYSPSDFAEGPWAFVTKAELTTVRSEDPNKGAECTYDLLDVDGDFTGINAYRSFTMDMSFLFTAPPKSQATALYVWRIPYVRLDGDSSGEIRNLEDDMVYGHYTVSRGGTVYVVLNRLGDDWWSQLDWNLKFTALWDEPLSNGRVEIGFGSDPIVIGLDMRRADVSKSGSHLAETLDAWFYDCDILAIDDVPLHSIDDVLTVGYYDPEIKAYCEKTGRPIETLLYMEDAVLRYVDPNGRAVEADLAATVRQDGTDSSGNPLLRYHFDMLGVSFPAGTQAALTYVIHMDPELLAYLDLADVRPYGLRNTVELYFSDEDPVTDADGRPVPGTSSNEVKLYGFERPMIGKEASVQTVDGASLAKWTVRVAKGLGYSTGGMLVCDELSRYDGYPELAYVPDMGFTVTYGGKSVSPGICVDCAHGFDSLDAASAGGAVHFSGNRFKYFLPDDVSSGDDVSLEYWSTYDAESHKVNGILNQVDLVNGDERDSNCDIVSLDNIRQYHDGVHVDDDGYLYTNYTMEVSVPAGMEMNAFHIEDYLARKSTIDKTLLTPDGRPVWHDGLRVDDGTDNWFYTSGHFRGDKDVLAANGVSVSIVRLDEFGNEVDATWADEGGIIAKFRASGFRVAHDGSAYFTFRLEDEAHDDDTYHGGISAQPYPYIVRITRQMYLNGDVESFPTHTDKVVLYWNQNDKGQLSHSSGAEATIHIPHVNNDDQIGHAVVDSRPSPDDPTKTILTYRAWYDMRDVSRPGNEGIRINDRKGSYWFDMRLPAYADGSRYASYVDGSLKVFWGEGPGTRFDDPDSSGRFWAWSQAAQDSVVKHLGGVSDGVTDYAAYVAAGGDVHDLLALGTKVAYYNGSVDGVGQWIPIERMASVVPAASDDDGFRVYVPYYRNSNHFRYKDPDTGDNTFYSPILEWQVEVDTQSMSDAKDYRVDVMTEFRSFLRDPDTGNVGELDGFSRLRQQVNISGMEKDLIEIPTKDNGYVARYRITIDNRSADIRAMSSIDVIDELGTSQARFVPEGVSVERRMDGALSPDLSGGDVQSGQWEALDPSRYQLMHDQEANQLTCRIPDPVGDEPSYYRITYSVRLDANRGETVRLSNRAWIVGLPGVSGDASEDVPIVELDSSAASTDASITVFKYNRDNLAECLSGVGFTLYALKDGADVSGLDGTATAEALPDSAWEPVPGCAGVTDADGRITWTHNTGGVEIPVERLLRLAEDGAPEGYVPPVSDTYFYLSSRNEQRTDHLAHFDRHPIITTVYVENARAQLALSKRDGADIEKRLAGAVFGIYSDEGCSDLILTSVDKSGSDGSLGLYYFGNLEMGRDYYMREIQAPEGYEVSDTVYKVRVENDGRVSVYVKGILGLFDSQLSPEDGAYVVLNRAVGGPPLPKTGGIGIYAILLAGAVLFGSSAATILIIAWKKRRDA